MERWRAQLQGREGSVVAGLLGLTVLLAVIAGVLLSNSIRSSTAGGTSYTSQASSGNKAPATQGTMKDAFTAQAGAAPQPSYAAQTVPTVKATTAVRSQTSTTTTTVSISTTPSGSTTSPTSVATSTPPTLPTASPSPSETDPEWPPMPRPTKPTRITLPPPTYTLPFPDPAL